MNGGEECEPLRGYRYYRRSFLNRPGFHASAFVFATVTSTKADDETGCDTELTIADCHRSICLSIECYSEESAANSLYKLDTLIETLTEFREAFKKECEVQRERERRMTRVDVLTA